MKNTLLCPVCGSEHIKKSTDIKHAQLTLGDGFTFTRENYHCETCGEEGDFALSNDANFKVALKAASSNLVTHLIDDLGEQKISMARVERAFELPIRTLARWKAGDFSATAVALLRVISTCPWMVSVAEHGFDRHALETEIYAQTMKNLEHRMMETNGHREGETIGIARWISGTAVGGAIVISTVPKSDGAVIQSGKMQTLVAAG